ncbi:MAG: FAD-dependent oxidoreductase [Candidatus Krumholzibacteriota bacterium]|nr:FAD-dependent oxidoreductase [Candidatus Krumholzibacteriota bacterium]
MIDRRLFRLKSHPILSVKESEEIPFTYNGQRIFALKGEMLSSALFANGIRVFGHHSVDGAPQGIFCANGQCSQCTVLVDGVPLKSCMTVARPGMRVTSCEGVPPLPEDDAAASFRETEMIETEVLIIGGGPAGINAAIELGKLGADVLIVDDKKELGGKLTLQTHPFFGSTEDCYAGERGIDIAEKITGELEKYNNVKVFNSTIAVGAFDDKVVGLYKDGRYILVSPKAAVVSCGAREKSLAFPGCDLPGIYGAGAFQTLLNRDLIRPTERLFIVGGGNVGLIAGYHAIQAGIKVVGLAEALQSCGGYKVHLDKLLRLGVPVFTSHTVVEAEGSEQLERITVAGIDSNFNPLRGTFRTYEVDTLLIAVGLSPVNELYLKLKEFGIEVFTCGDSEDISEASAAIFSGKITGRKVARFLGNSTTIPKEWNDTERVLRSEPGETIDFKPEECTIDTYPIIRCVEEIPCDPCVHSCPVHSISLRGDSIMGLPVFDGNCIGCMKCVSSCPALAITLIRPSEKRGKSHVVIPFELEEELLAEGKKVMSVGMKGAPLGKAEIVKFRRSPDDKRRLLVTLEVPDKTALDVAGIRIQEPEEVIPEEKEMEYTDDDTIVCRCERVTAGEIKKEILSGVRDMNVLKATLRTGMGSCGGKTCTDLILRLFRECGVELSEVTPPTDRPFVAEIPLSTFAGTKDGEENDAE